MRCNSLFELRCAQPADLPQVVAMRRQAGLRSAAAADLRSHLTVPWGHMWVVCAGQSGPVVANIDFWVVVDEVHLHDLVVSPDQRRAGLGRELLAVLLRWATRRRLRQIILEVRANNAAALALYRGAHFVQVGVRAGYYDHGAVDALLLQRRLPGGAGQSAHCRPL